MSPLRQRMLEDMRLRNLAPGTQETYVRAVLGFSAFHGGKPPQTLGAEQVRQYMVSLRDRGVSWSRYNTIRSALKFFFHVTLGRQGEFNVPYPKQARRLPTVLSVEQVQRFLGVIGNPKHRVMFMTAYGAGLRVSELVNLRIRDIDSPNMLIHIRGKGGHERCVKLSWRLLEALREYYRRYRPRDLLFPGRKPGQPLDPHTIRAAARSLARRAGLAVRISPHTFRHCYATHMLDAGADLRTIQVQLGHRHIRTSTIYLHVSKARIQAGPNPLDLMPRLPDVAGGAGDAGTQPPTP
jgi:integrase/recombinase XerD